MALKEEEKLIEKKFEAAQDKIVRDNILLVYTKSNSKKYSEYQVNISFTIKKNKVSKEDYEFILEINLTKKTIILFSKNINPLSDGRDIFPLISKFSIISNNFFFIDDINIQDIVTNIKKFLENKKFTDMGGFFYIGEEYTKKIIDSLENIAKIPCTHLDIVNGKLIEISSLCTISDENFCLYEKQQNKYILIFYSNLKNLMSFNKTIDSVVTLNWKKKFSNNEKGIKYSVFELKIQSNVDEDMDKVMDILIEKIKHIGFEMNIKEQKKGVLPDINAEKIEGEINRLESQLKNKENILVFNKLLDRYEKIIEFYSAANNNKYTEYSKKMKELLGNDKYAKYIN